MTRLTVYGGGCLACRHADGHAPGCPFTYPHADRASTVSFSQPLHQLTMNQRLHWADKGRAARAWRDATSWEALRAWPSPKLRRRDPSFVAVSLEVRGGGRRDPHNWAPTVKPIIDGLVDAGVWPDDTPQWVTTVEPLLVPVARQGWEPLFCTVVLIPRQEA